MGPEEARDAPAHCLRARGRVAHARGPPRASRRRAARGGASLEHAPCVLAELACGQLRVARNLVLTPALQLASEEN